MSHYDEIARRFFNEFLELKISLETQGAITPDQQTQDRKRYERELAKWEKGNAELRRSAEMMAQQLSELEAEVDKLTTANQELRLQVNELIMQNESMRARHRIPKDDPGSYPLTQHMSERAFNEWQKILKEIPYQGNKGDEDA